MWTSICGFDGAGSLRMRSSFASTRSELADSRAARQGSRTWYMMVPISKSAPERV